MSRIFQFSSSGPRVRLEGYTAIGLIVQAYDLQPYQISVTPAVSRHDETYFDVVAKAEGDDTPTKAEFREMLQTLLAERYNLKVHRELKEMPVYALGP
jgi:uncharacterized protein (TIGR03435 family)